MSFRDLFSKLKKKAKVRLTGNEPKPGRTGNQEGEGPYVSGGAGKVHSDLHPDVGAAAGSKPSREGNDADGGEVGRVHPSPSTTSILHSGKPDSTWIWVFLPLPLIIPLRNAGTSPIPDRGPATVLTEESAGPGAVADGNKSNLKSTASATAKLILRGVSDAADAFGPLKSVAGGLCFILENCEVQSCSDPPLSPRRSSVLQRMKANKQAIESLAPRVKVLADILCVPASDGDVGEKSRRKRLER